ncbi:MAG TPA: hypothetical protein VFV92_06410 [Candidatus Bathyarchaeia archaeon]|nr:hypothetical protein [Candidatus Bathyarchaeia archaeon]
MSPGWRTIDPQLYDDLAGQYEQASTIINSVTQRGSWQNNSIVIATLGSARSLDPTRVRLARSNNSLKDQEQAVSTVEIQ